VQCFGVLVLGRGLVVICSVVGVLVIIASAAIIGVVRYCFCACF